MDDKQHKDRYVIVRAVSTTNLCQRVNGLVEEGYVPIGGLVIDKGRSERCADYYLQTMWRPNNVWWNTWPVTVSYTYTAEPAEEYETQAHRNAGEEAG